MPRLPARLVAVAVVLCVGAPVLAQAVYPGYRWIELGGGVYVVSRSDPFAGPVDGNSTVIINDRDVVVVDTHINPAVARAVIAKIREITDNPVTTVVNTHFHDDHTNGNHAYRKAFPDAAIVSHRETLRLLKEEWEPLEQSRKDNYGPLRDRDLEEAAKRLEATNPDRAMGIRLVAGYRDALLPELDGMELIYPDTVFGDEIILLRGERRIEIRWLGAGNTAGDVVVWLPDEKILLTGDLLVHPVPYAFDSPMADWIGTLKKLHAFEAETLVPGHGEIQHDFTYADQVAGLLAATLDAARAAKAEGLTLEEAQEEIQLETWAAKFAGTGQAQDFAQDFAWRSYYLVPGIASAWAALESSE